jgi:hypothetical protein
MKIIMTITRAWAAAIGWGMKSLQCEARGCSSTSGGIEVGSEVADDAATLGDEE